MLRHIYKLLLILLVLTAPAWAAQDAQAREATGAPDWQSIEVLDLSTAKRIALAQNPSLEAAAQRVSQAKERIRQATATYWPWLDVSGGVSRVDISDNNYDSNLAMAKLFNPAATIDNPQDYTNAKASVTWLLFDGFEREFNRKAAKFGETVFTQSESDTRRKIFSAVAGAYYNAQSAREDIAIAKADGDFNTRLMEEAKVRYDLGAGSLSDVLNFEIAVRGAETQLITGERTYEVAMLGLAALLGIDDRTFVEKVSLERLAKETDKDMAAPDEAHYVQAARDQRPDVLQAQATLAQAESSVGAAKGKFYPTLGLSASMEGTWATEDDYSNKDVESRVGANLSYNLFAGNLHRAKLAEARAAEREAKASLAQTTLSAVQEVHEAAAKVRFAQEQVLLQEETAGLVQQNRDLVEKEYQAGQASLVRLNEAQRDLIQVQSNLARARVFLRQAWEELYTSTGSNSM